MLSGCSEFPNNHFFVQFSFFENIGNMFTNSCFTFIKQSTYLLLIQPHGFILQSHVKFYTFIKLVNDHFAQIRLSLKTLLILGEELGKVGVNHFLLYHSHVLAIVQKS